MLHVAKVMIQSAGHHRSLLTIIVWFWQNDNSDSGRCRLICWGVSWLVCLKVTRGGMSHNAAWLDISTSVQLLCMYWSAVEMWFTRVSWVQMHTSCCMCWIPGSRYRALSNSKG
jgi:hypothetical protein